jgi:hypothetical protein
MNQPIGLRGLAHAALTVVVVAMGVVLWAQPASAYTCTSTAHPPYNVNVSGETKVRGKGTAACPASNQYKELSVTLIRIETYLPDVRIASRTDTGSQSSYQALPTGCDRNELKGYKSVEKFTGNPEHTSGTVNLTCRT